MSENNANNQDNCQSKKCPILKIPVDVIVPDNSDKELEEYNKIQRVKKQNLNDIRVIAHREAERVRANSKVDNELKRDTAKKAFETAQMIKNSKTKKEETRVEYEIKKYYDEYKKSLLDASHAIPSLKNCEKSDDLPEYIKIIYITDFHKKIAELLTGYQNNLKVVEKELFDATKAWDQAQDDFCNDECDADALEIKAKLEADFTWRTNLKAEVDTACKA
jgi:hypothetical protein